MDSIQLVIASGRCSFPECWPLQRSHQNSGRRLFWKNAIFFCRFQAKSRDAQAGEHLSHVKQGHDEGFGNESFRTGSETFFGHPTEKSELAALRENVTRSRFIRKLSEANQYGRHLQRQLREKEQALNKCRNEFALMEIELKALLSLAQEVAKQGVVPGARKINGKYIQSHLALRLEEMHERLLSRGKDVDDACYRNVPLVWYGMAEDVKVMGSFDGWSRGEQMSPEDSGTFTKFTTTLKLPPGQYEIKFLVDGEWRVSPEWPIVGEGLIVNNTLLVK